MGASPVPNASAKGLEDLSSLHTDALRTRPQRHPTRMPKVGQLSFMTEGPYPSELPGVWGRPGKGFGLQGGPQSTPGATRLSYRHSFICIYSLFPLNHVPAFNATTTHNPIKRGVSIDYFFRHCPVFFACWTQFLSLCSEFSFANLVL